MLALIFVLCLSASAFAMEDHPLVRGFWEVLWDAMVAAAVETIESWLGFSLTTLIEVAVSLGTAIYTQFMNLLVQAVQMGQAVVMLMAPILQQLVFDVTNHIADAAIYFQQAMAQMQAVLLGAGKRDANDMSVRDFWSNLWDALWAAAVNEIEIWLGFSISTLVEVAISLGTAVYQQFMSLLYQAVQMGQAVVQLMAPILTQLIYDVTNHISDAAIYFQQAMAQMQAVLLGAGKREITEADQRAIDWLNWLLVVTGLDQVLTTILGMGQELYNNFMTTLGQIVAAGQAIIMLTVPILTQLVLDVTNHVADAWIYVENAIAQMTALLAGK